jgi:hypothetical protein
LDPEEDTSPEQRPVTAVRLEARRRGEKLFPVDTLNAHRPVESYPGDGHGTPVAAVTEISRSSNRFLTSRCLQHGSGGTEAVENGRNDQYVSSQRKDDAALTLESSSRLSYYPIPKPGMRDKIVSSP